MTGSTAALSRLFRSLRTAALVLIASGCGISEGDEDNVVIAKLIVAGIAHAVPHKAEAAKLDHILAVRSKKNGSGTTIRPHRELWKPFRVEATLGLPDANHDDLGTDGSFGVSVLEASGVGRFYIVKLKRSGTGVAVEVGTGGAPLGTLAIPDGFGADVVLESVGGIVLFSGRKIGDAAYTQIAAASATSAGPYQLSLDVSGLPKKTVVGFDLLRLVKNGAPASPTAAQTLSATLYTAFDALLEAMYAIDGGTPDRAKAGDQIELAVARLDAALAMDLTGFKTTRTRAAAARKKAAKLVAGARGTKSANSVIAALIGTAKLAGLAAYAAK